MTAARPSNFSQDEGALKPAGLTMAEKVQQLENRADSADRQLSITGKVLERIIIQLNTLRHELNLPPLDAQHFSSE